MCAGAHADGTEVHAGLGLLDFGYKEFSESGALLDREDGVLPGIVVEVARRAGDWRLSGNWRFFSGSAGYDGSTNLGAPVSTETDERLQSLSLRLARRLHLGAWPLVPYVGYGYYQWRRDIRPTRTAANAPVSGLFEVYTWKSAELGVLAQVLSWNRFEGGLDVRVFRVLDPEVKVRFATGADEVRLALGERAGARLGFAGAYPLGAQLSLRLELYHERWSFGRSSSQPLTSGGAVIGSVVEPRSETRNSALTLGLVYSL